MQPMQINGRPTRLVRNEQCGRCLTWSLYDLRSGELLLHTSSARRLSEYIADNNIEIVQTINNEPVKERRYAHQRLG